MDIQKLTFELMKNQKQQPAAPEKKTRRRRLVKSASCCRPITPDDIGDRLVPGAYVTIFQTYCQNGDIIPYAADQRSGLPMVVIAVCWPFLLCRSLVEIHSGDRPMAYSLIDTRVHRMAYVSKDYAQAFVDAQQKKFTIQEMGLKS